MEADNGDSQFLLEQNVEEQMRIHLTEFFLPPWVKWRTRSKFPFKLVVHILLLVTVTTQVVLFGSVCSAHVTYSERANIAFRHLYLKDWEPDYETLPYPPSTGIFAVYTQSQIYESLGYSLQQFNLTETDSASGYTFSDGNKTAKVCVEQYNAQTVSKGFVLGIECANINLMETSPNSFSNAESVAKFLADLGIIIDFSRFQNIFISFSLDSPPVHHMDWDRSVECFRFQIKIQFDNSGQTGQVLVNLQSRLTNIDCDQAPHPNGLVDGLFRANISPLFRRVVHLFVDLLAFTLALLSTALCLKALVRSIHLLRKTTSFFEQFYGIRLQGVFFSFVSPWFFFALVSNMLIISGSVFKLFSDKDVLQSYSEWSYLLGLGTLFVWLGILRYIGFSSSNNLLLKTITRSVPALLRFSICALVLYFAFVFCAWAILGPFHIKFRTLTSTLECLFSLLNGDDMYVTFSVIVSEQGWVIFVFSRIFLYCFITLFIYVVLNIFITIIFEAYEEVKERQANTDFSSSNPLWHFIYSQPNNPLTTPIQPEVDENEQIIHCSTSGASWHRMSSSNSNSVDEQVEQCREQELGVDMTTVSLDGNDQADNPQPEQIEDIVDESIPTKPVGRSVSFR